MSCSSRRNIRFADLELVKGLAQITANTTQLSQKIYVTYCNGAKIYNYSHDWKGREVCKVRPIFPETKVQQSGQPTSENVLRDSKKRKRKSLKSKRKDAKREAGGAMEEAGRGVLLEDKQEELQASNRQGEKKVDAKEQDSSVRSSSKISRD